MEKLEHLQIPLEKIRLATNNFGGENLIGEGAFGPVYKGRLLHSGRHLNVAVKRLKLRQFGQGRREFLMEIYLLSCFKHENLVSLVGFCDESNEKALVYEQEIHGSLDGYLGNLVDLTWTKRLRICSDVARGLHYLHSGVGGPPVLHRDIKSSNVLLNEDWEAKISDFGLSRMGPANEHYSFLVSNACGTMGYVDPAYLQTGILTKESDVYSFGVLLFEVLCGRLGCVLEYEDERRFLARLAQHHYEQGQLDAIINPLLREGMDANSLETFSTIAYQCLKDDRRQRPKMDQILQELTTALELQLQADSIQETPLYGDPTMYPEWSILLQADQKLNNITVEHDLRPGKHSLRVTTKIPNAGRFRFSGKIGPSSDQVNDDDGVIKIADLGGTTKYI